MQQPSETEQFTRVVAKSGALRSHQDVFEWLQGDMQRFVPHQIMVSAWGDFRRGHIQHDIISSMAGVRSQHVNTQALAPLLSRCFTRWHEAGEKAYSLSAGAHGFMLNSNGLDCNLTRALRHMRSVMVHAIHDRRRDDVCLYLTFSTANEMDEAQSTALRSMLPHLDNALRQVELLPSDFQPLRLSDKAASVERKYGTKLTQRELEILEWISLGKTNPEIGSILSVSLFTVKNHIQRIFRKLNVSNRAQAVAELTHDD
jgi:transcriptional regulator EpsA